MQIDRPISIAIVLFSAVLLAYFFTVPKYNDLKALELELAQKKAEFNAQYDYYSEITENFDEIKKRKEDIKKIDDALPASANLGQAAFYLQNQAKNSGLILKSMSLSQGVAGNVKEIIFSLNMAGDYYSLQNFIIGLEESARIFEITSVSFTSSSGLAGQADASGTVGQEFAEEEMEQSQFLTGQIFNFSLEVKTYSY